MIIDLHQDWSDNALYLTHKDFFIKNKTISGWNYFGYPTFNQVDWPRIQEGKLSMVLGAICLLPQDMFKSVDYTRSILQEHLSYYEYVIEKSNNKIKKILRSDDISENNFNLLIHLEGCYFLDDADTQCNYMDKLLAMGIRSFALTRNTDNNLSGGSGSKKGVTGLGFSFAEKVVGSGSILDLAHISEVGFRDLVKVIKSPLMVSHTQLSFVNDHKRNISDAQLVALAENGGIVGLSPHGGFLGEKSIEKYIFSIRHAMNIGGISSVGLGSDFDGFASDSLIQGFNNVSQYPSFAEILLDNGFSTFEVESFMGGNAKRFIKSVLK